MRSKLLLLARLNRVAIVAVIRLTLSLYACDRAPQSPAAPGGVLTGDSQLAAPKVNICRLNVTGRFLPDQHQKPNAWPEHQAHGDGLPLGPVPGDGGSVFDASCVPHPVPVATYTVGGTVSGLVADTGLVLRNNGGDDLTISGNGTFHASRPRSRPGLSTRSRSSRSPQDRRATVTAGSGTVASAKVTDVSVVCENIGAKRVFVSSTSSSANLGGIAGADSTCQTLANTAGLGGSTWKAWLSVSGTRQPRASRTRQCRIA